MIFFLLGLITGAIGGMGIGGGTILIPSIILLTNLKQQTVQSINLISFIPVAIVALVVHYRNKNILLKLSYPLIFFGIFGTFIGSKLALTLSSTLLRKWFGVFLLIMGIYEVFYKGKKKE
ncbi:sulfite exporter TauE/SafE family protein [Alkaliphilus sp. MSJ-5]|uniref:Probable membrane transporter protein n=1 Tax=Alkaliphilus flagellatus TaxID=2841507 RepID=A0ABS6G5B2_9FIRM|nr:sulfite exporter TauE/SafE family protein [Alkaliphilus flagellatus]MBU5677667.1 sulfite exporter TauE/SafE family protein [Alkaliphilus flagellatus]